MLHPALSARDRSHVLRFAALFLWADDEVADSERRFLDDLARELDVDDAHREVATLLARPPEVDPADIRPAIADLVRRTALRAIAADGRVHRDEMAMFELLDDLLPRDEREDWSSAIEIEIEIDRGDNIEDGWVVDAETAPVPTL
jgi:hypothetical protein